MVFIHSFIPTERSITQSIVEIHYTVLRCPQGAILTKANSVAIATETQSGEIVYKFFSFRKEGKCPLPKSLLYSFLKSPNLFMSVSTKTSLDIPFSSKGENFLQNFISSRDGPVKSAETRQRGKYARRLPNYRTIGEKNSKKTTLYLLYGVVFLSFFFAVIP